MLTQEALKYLYENLQGHQYIAAEDAVSDLISLPNSSNIESLEQFQAAPNRIKQKANLFSCASFCEYVNRFKADSTSIYLNVDGGSFSAVIDHHDNDAPAWGSHRASFSPKLSQEWRAWNGIHKKQLSQLELAHFIEENLDGISEPAPNEMLKAALDFESNESLALGSATNLDDGSTRFTFQKENVTKNVTFPHRIKLFIPLHENEDRQTLDARIRYRTTGDGVLIFTFSFVKDPRAIERDALLLLADKIRTDTEGLHQYEGAL